MFYAISIFIYLTWMITVHLSLSGNNTIKAALFEKISSISSDILGQTDHEMEWKTHPIIIMIECLGSEGIYLGYYPVFLDDRTHPILSLFVFKHTM